jgi:hypothetical protein
MLADMHVVQGLANLRLLNIKRAGRCFDEAKAFKVPRKSQMLILIQSTFHFIIIPFRMHVQDGERENYGGFP